MKNEDIIRAVILILENVEFENVEILGRQLESAQSLLDAVSINVIKDIKCIHPQEVRKNLTTMGDTEKTEQCTVCGAMIISEL